jgi:hypothetical protein
MVVSFFDRISGFAGFTGRILVSIPPRVRARLSGGVSDLGEALLKLLDAIDFRKHGGPRRNANARYVLRDFSGDVVANRGCGKLVLKRFVARLPHILEDWSETNPPRYHPC